MNGKVHNLKDPEFLHEIVLNLKEGILLSDHHGQLLDANPAFLNLFGAASVKELQTLFTDQLRNPGMRAKELDRLIPDGPVREFEVQIESPNGSLHTAICIASARYDPETGNVIFLEILNDISDIKILEQRLIEQNLRDPLTGCFNRRYLEDFETRSSMANSWGCIVVYMDRLKHYRERYGYEAGQDAILRMSRFLMSYIRAEEGVVRREEEKFVVVLPGTDLPGTRKVFRRLQTIALGKAPLSFSIGAAARDKEEPLEKTIQRAEHNLTAVRVLERSPKKRRKVI